MHTDRADANKAPAYQWYPRDFASDEPVQLMTLEQEGAYRRLLDHQWMHNSIPEGPAQLAKICKNIPVAQMRRIWVSIAVCFVPVEGEEGRLQNRKLERVRAVSREYHERQSAAGRRGAAARWDRKQQGQEDDGANGGAMATPLAEGMANDSSASAPASASASASASQSSSVGPDADPESVSAEAEWLLAAFQAQPERVAVQQFLECCPASDRISWARRLSGYLAGLDFPAGACPTPAQLATACSDYSTSPPNPIHFRAFVLRVMRERCPLVKSRAADDRDARQTEAGRRWAASGT
jgi:uncharacterized protein YdaU (DUF1376 family)